MMPLGCKIWHCCVDNKWASDLTDPKYICASLCIQMWFKMWFIILLLSKIYVKFQCDNCIYDSTSVSFPMWFIVSDKINDTSINAQIYLVQRTNTWTLQTDGIHTPVWRRNVKNVSFPKKGVYGLWKGLLLQYWCAIIRRPIFPLSIISVILA